MKISHFEIYSKFDLVSKQVFILMLMYPMVYLVANLLNNTMIYGIKDIFIYLISFQLLLIFFYNGLKIKTYFLIIFISFVYVMLNSIYHYSDLIFWLFGIREMVVNPFLFIIIGFYIAAFNGEKILSFYSLSLISATIFTILYPLVNYSQSFGMTGRLMSFWDSEHEPAIIGSLMIIWLLCNKNWKLHYLLLFISSFIVIILSGSRSILIALFISVIFIIFLNMKGIKKYLLLVGVFGSIFLIYHFYDLLFTRPIDYHVSARTSQWMLAFSNIKHFPLFGIGIDKYGAVGGVEKVFYLDGYSTVTMDSSLIKYTVNLGLLFILLWFVIILSAFYRLKKLKGYFSSSTTGIFPFIKAVILFAVIIGAFTGKLGAFPLNMYFYSIIGTCFGLYTHYKRKYEGFH